MSKDNRKKIRESLAKRNRSERHFQWFGKLGVILGLAAVVLLFVDIISKGSGAFRATYIQLEIEYDPDAIGVLDVNDKEELIFANWQNFAKKSLRDLFPEVTKRGEKRKLNNLVSEGAGFDFRDQLAQSPNLWGTKETLWILADDDIDTYYKSWLDGDPFSARLTSEQVKWIDQLHSKGLIALKFNTKLIKWNIKSTTKAHQGLYEYDAVSRLRDSQLGNDKVNDVANYIKKGVLWNSFISKKRPVLLIDEIDKADIEFPNDLLQELDTMEFFVYETGEFIKAKQRPIVIITSNNEKELPDAFLRRCFFHYIQFPDRETMNKIVSVHYPKIKKKLVSEALEIFFDLRKIPGLKKKPSTSELIDWLKLLLSDDMPDEILKNADSSKAIPPLYGALLKNEQDVQLLERLAFMSRRESNSK